MMKKYIIPVGSEEISKDVQEALFRAGFSWGCDGRDQEVKTRDEWFLVVNSRFNKSMSYGQDSPYHMRQILDNGSILISSQEVIADPFQLDGATKPARELTMEDLEEHFGEPIKITKKK